MSGSARRLVHRPQRVRRSAWSAPSRESLVSGGHERSPLVRRNRRLPRLHAQHLGRRSVAGAASNPTSSSRRAPAPRHQEGSALWCLVVQAGARLSGAAGGGLPCQPSSAWRSAAAPTRWGVPRPRHRTERFATVSRGTSSPRWQVRSWGNRPGWRTPIRMRSQVQSARPTPLPQLTAARSIIDAGPSGQAAPVRATGEQESANRSCAMIPMLD
jgi:hypothetical protein